jgi:uncharacterized membrane protein
MSGTLPTWLDRYFGLPPGTAGEGTAWRLDHSWPLAAWLTLLAVAAIVVLVVVLYAFETGGASRFRRVVLAGLRLTAIGLVLLMIAQWVLMLNPTQLPYVVVLVDDSESMKIADHYDNAALREDIARRVRASGLTGLTRLNEAKTLLLENDAALLTALDTHYKLRVYFISELARPQSGDIAELRSAIRRVEPTGKSTRLGDCLRAVLSDQGLSGVAAVVLLTDGVTTDGEKLCGDSLSSAPTNAFTDANSAAAAAGAGAADFARSKGIPLFIVGLGSEQPLKDLELSDLRVSDVAFVNDILAFKFNLTGAGFAGRQIEIRLRDKRTGAVLARQNVVVGSDHKLQEISLSYRPDKEGEYDFVIETDNLADEVRYDNNRLQRQVSVRKAQIRVLLVEAYPNYEFRYLKNLLERDNTIQLHTVLQDADAEYAAAEKAALPVFPVRREDLFQYDVVIFGDVNPELLSSSTLANLADFVVQKGGGLVMIAGPSFNPLQYRDTPLAPLVPVETATATAPDPRRPITDGFVIQPTDEGLASPNMQLGDSPAETLEIWRKLPSVYWLLEAQKKESAEVLAEHPTRRGADGRKLPVILERRSGAGMVIFHATDETWRWRFQVGDVFFARYWVQTIRYLSRTKLLGKDQVARLSTDRKEYGRGDRVRLRLEFTDPRQTPSTGQNVTVMITRGEEPQQQLKLAALPENPELFEGTFEPPGDGNYRARVIEPMLPGEPSASFNVKVSEVEFERTQMDAAEMQCAATKTKGRFYTWTTAAAVLEDLPVGRHVAMKQTAPPIELWNRWPILLLLFAALVGEWTLRKRSGMV